MRSGASPQLHSPRLLLRSPCVALTSTVMAFQTRNAAHFEPWDPDHPPGHFEAARVAERLSQGEQAFALGSDYRYWFSLSEAAADVIGQVHISQLSRGAFQSAVLGYSLDAMHQGRGLMNEALGALIDEMFGPDVHLHRIQAAVRPQNTRSRKVLQRLGFELEGLSRRYLHIHGAWRDHEVFALINPGWPPDLPP
jgi:ribosomal-protein-alanine N-acetyltransferase